MNSFDQLLSAFNIMGYVYDNTLIVEKWNWDYLEALEFQKAAQKMVAKNKQLKVFIFCNHPHCFTLGRGNERGVESLLEFDSSIESSLNFPVHRIKRGGGITFHYPGQWIFYPIIALGPTNSMSDLMNWMLKSVRDTVADHFNVKDVVTANKLMGVWHKRRKLASIGMGADRFITEHGLALNLIYDEKMFNELSKISPCGISSTTYISLDQITNSSENLIEKFHKAFLSDTLNIQ